MKEGMISLKAKTIKERASITHELISIALFFLFFERDAKCRREEIRHKGEIIR